MHKVERNDLCPCGSGKKYKKCCGPALAGDQWPETPEALMRSRYTAYVVGNTAHLWRTCHPENEMVKGADREQFDRETLAYCKAVEFQGLTVNRTWPPDENGAAKVLFTTSYRIMTGQTETFNELSEFVQLDGKWVYLKGDSIENPDRFQGA